MARFKTFTNGGNLLPGDLDAFEDDYECAFGTYKVLFSDSTTIGGGTIADIYSLGRRFDAATQSGGGNLENARHLNPAHYWTDAATNTVNPRTVYYMVETTLIAGHGPTGTVTYTVGLAPITGMADDALVPNPGTGDYLTLGSFVAGSTITVANPASSSLHNASSGDFVAPTSGFYALAVQLSASPPSGSVYTKTAVRATLSVRQI